MKPDPFPLSWDELRLVKAVADHRGMAGAAAELAISQSTVFRRLEQIERTLGVVLFERHRAGYTPTPTGEEMVAVAAGIETELLGFPAAFPAARSCRRARSASPPPTACSCICWRRCSPRSRSNTPTSTSTSCSAIRR